MGSAGSLPTVQRWPGSLIKTLKKNYPTSLKLDDCEEAADTAKREFMSTAVLGLPQEMGHSAVDKDASDYQKGCVILQRHNNDALRPNGYWSRALNLAETRYISTLRDSLRVVYAVMLLGLYVGRNHVVMRNDHQT